MSDLIIHGGKPLSGTITPSGNKNSVLPILCATLLTDAPVTLKNVPNITDVEKLVTFFAEQGSQVAWDRATHTIKRIATERDAKIIADRREEAAAALAVDEMAEPMGFEVE